MISCTVEYAETCENALRIANDFVRLSSVGSDVARRAACAAAAVAGVEASDEAGRDLRVGLAVRAAAECCYYSVIAASSANVDPTSCLQKVANQAVRAARQMDEIDDGLAIADYEALVKIFGNQESVVLGEPFDPSDDGPLGDAQK